ncbi:MAG: alpha/beta hydrolase [Sphingomonas sp.]|uniref:alpha/beta fold hydrolase n=1 Tax=Sphingomonas sp. TaxID=28214 RepID=UPI0026361805|nr:alpha/beta hydrolase [Sphingomonas sp.]MDK2768102.1 alpha/beta hydrolase [Sphingomonas sp.]
MNDRGSSTAYSDREWQTADGLTLFARDYAAVEGPARLPIICLHGLTRNSRDFAQVAPWLSSLGYRVLVPDVRGRGESDYDANSANYLPKTYAKDVLGLMDALGIGRAIFIGTSMGGIITMAVAAIRSKAIAAAILNDVGPIVAPQGLKRIMSYAGKSTDVTSWAEAVDYVKGTGGAAYPAFSDADWRTFAETTFREDQGRIVLNYDTGIMEPIRRGKVKAPGWLAWLMFRRLARRRPVMLVRGAISDLITPEIALRMKKAAPHLQVAEVPGIGHAPMLTEPVAKQEIASFLRSLGR